MKKLLRSLEISKLSLKVGMKELRSSSVASRIDQAKMITQSLSQLKGAAMKVGQLMSIDLADYFPPEATEILAQLQADAKSDDVEVIQDVLRSELGAERFNELISVSKKPIATASIAQVHTGYYRGKKVAIKVQHQGVADSIDTDLGLMKKLVQTVAYLSSRQMDFDPLFKEMETMLKQETDFHQELNFLERYRSNLQELNRYGERYVAPVAIPQMSTKKVLVMSWEEGIGLGPWLKKNPPREQREELANLLLNLYCHEFYLQRLVQTDPNYSNFLIKEGVPMTIVLLDFGATREYSQEFVEQYVRLLKAVASGEQELILREAIEFKLLDARESEEAKALFIEMMEVAAEPFLSKSGGGRFDFGNKDYSNRSLEILRRFSGSLKFSPPPEKIIFLHRKLGGLFALLKKLDVRVDLGSYWQRMVGA